MCETITFFSAFSFKFMHLQKKVNTFREVSEVYSKNTNPDLKLWTGVFLGRSEKETTLFIIKVPLRQLLSDVGSKAMQSKYA